MDKKYEINGFDMAKVRNRNERRVVEAMRKAVEKTKGFCGCQLCLEDVYALSMNKVPSHYVQAGAIILGAKTPPDKGLEKIVLTAVKAVKKTPNHT